MRVIATIRVEQTKPDITGAHFDALKAWIKTNIIDTLPSDTTSTFEITIRS